MESKSMLGFMKVMKMRKFYSYHDLCSLKQQKVATEDLG